MLVLALEFSKGSTAHAHLTGTTRWCSGTCGARGQEPPTTGNKRSTWARDGTRRHRGHGTRAVPSKRKSESPTQPTGAGSVSGGLQSTRDERRPGICRHMSDAE
jgi:hypothetical protein